MMEKSKDMINIIVYIIKSVINKEAIIYTNKGQKINVRAFVLVTAGTHLLIFLMASGFTGLISIPWFIFIIIGMISGIVYRPYKEESDSNNTTADVS